MANTGKIVATLLIGAAVGAAVGYVLATDDKKRKEDLDKIKDQVTTWGSMFKKKADQFKKQAEDLESEVYHS